MPNDNLHTSPQTKYKSIKSYILVIKYFFVNIMVFIIVRQTFTLRKYDNSGMHNLKLIFIYWFNDDQLRAYSTLL